VFPLGEIQFDARPGLPGLPSVIGGEFGHFSSFFLAHFNFGNGQIQIELDGLEDGRWGPPLPSVAPMKNAKKGNKYAQGLRGASSRDPKPGKYDSIFNTTTVIIN
jgi:hypothetical protein